MTLEMRRYISKYLWVEVSTGYTDGDHIDIIFDEYEYSIGLSEEEFLNVLELAREIGWLE